MLAEICNSPAFPELSKGTQPSEEVYSTRRESKALRSVSWQLLNVNVVSQPGISLIFAATQNAWVLFPLSSLEALSVPEPVPIPLTMPEFVPVPATLSVSARDSMLKPSWGE